MRLKPLTHFFGGLIYWNDSARRHPFRTAYRNEAAQKRNTFYLRSPKVAVLDTEYIYEIECTDYPALEALAIRLQSDTILHAKHITLWTELGDTPTGVLQMRTFWRSPAAILGTYVNALPSDASLYIEECCLGVPIAKRHAFAIALVRLAAWERIALRVGSTCYELLWTTQELIESVSSTGNPGDFPFSNMVQLPPTEVAFYLCVTHKICHNVDIATFNTDTWLSMISAHIRNTVPDASSYLTLNEAVVLSAALDGLQRKPPNLKLQILVAVEKTLACTEYTFAISDAEVFDFGCYLGGITDTTAYMLFDKVDAFWDIAAATPQQGKVKCFQQCGLLMPEHFLNAFMDNLLH